MDPASFDPSPDCHRKGSNDGEGIVAVKEIKHDPNEEVGQAHISFDGLWA